MLVLRIVHGRPGGRAHSVNAGPIEHYPLPRTMRKKMKYRVIEPGLRLGIGRPPDGSSTYTKPESYVFPHEDPGGAAPIHREFLENVRRRNRRPLEAASRRALAWVDRALKKLR